VGIVASNMTAVVTLTTAIAILLTFAGFRHGLLSFRPEPRRCPSCGHRLRSWTCWSCTHSEQR
jgi:hypothetical protein